MEGNRLLISPMIGNGTVSWRLWTFLGRSAIPICRDATDGLVVVISIYTYHPTFLSFSLLLLWPLRPLSSLTLLILFYTMFSIVYPVDLVLLISDYFIWWSSYLPISLRSSIYSPCVSTSVLFLYFCFPFLSLPSVLCILIRCPRYRFLAESKHTSNGDIIMCVA